MARRPRYSTRHDDKPSLDFSPTPGHFRAIPFIGFALSFHLGMPAFPFTMQKPMVGTEMFLALMMLIAAGCNPSLPEPESPGAQVYRGRCSGCHRLYSPGSMKFEMWKVAVNRMQAELPRRGISPLSREEVGALLEYLERYSDRESTSLPK